MTTPTSECIVSTMQTSRPRIIRGSQQALDDVVTFCVKALKAALGGCLGMEAFKALPALEAVIFFKKGDFVGLMNWGRRWAQAR